METIGGGVGTALSGDVVVLLANAALITTVTIVTTKLIATNNQISLFIRVYHLVAAHTRRRRRWQPWCESSVTGGYFRQINQVRRLLYCQRWSHLQISRQRRTV